MKNLFSQNNVFTYKRKSKKGLFSSLLIILVFLIIFFIIFLFYKIYSPGGIKNSYEEFIVKEGETVKQISSSLKDQDLIKHSLYFNFYIFVKRADKKLKTGVYQINTKMSVADIANVLTGSQLSSEGKIIIIEGWNSKEIADYISDFHARYSTDNTNYEDIKKNFKKEFLAEVNNAKEYDYGFFADKPKEATLEGYLYPDTYYIYRDTEPEEIIRKMLENFDQKVTKEIRDQIRQKEMTLHEVLILASIIQKEVKSPDEMRRVAGVYFNRLAANKALESDSTLTYITGRKRARATGQDLKMDSPYNTYRYKGLPPGPIGNPCLEAIQAVLNPEEHDFMFFITDNETGEAMFSKTGKEHQKKVEEHLNK